MTVKNIPVVYRKIFQSDNTTGFLYIKYFIRGSIVPESQIFFLFSMAEINLKSATTRLYDTEAKIICIVSKKGAQCIECHHKDI